MKSELSGAPMFFLGANSPKGFVSRFGESFRQGDGWHTYIIKGGPGTGKSTLMKRVAAYFIKKNLRCHLCPCSSDPNSLDGVVFPDMRVTLLDGTSPHVVEPRYPGAIEEIVNLGDCWDIACLREKEEEIIRLTDLNREYHRRASDYLRAAGCIINDTAELAAGCCDIEKAKKYGYSLAHRMIPKVRRRGEEWRRYLSAVTPIGHIFYKTTFSKMCDEVAVISDEYGAASGAVLSAVRDFALDCGHEIITCLCPLSEREKIEHIIIPALRVGFATSNRYHGVESDRRVVHARRFMDMASLHEEKSHLSFNRRAAAEMLLSATEILGQAKDTHDKLEAQYISAMNFEAINKTTEELLKKIISLAN